MELSAILFATLSVKILRKSIDPYMEKMTKLNCFLMMKKVMSTRLKKALTTSKNLKTIQICLECQIYHSRAKLHFPTMIPVS